MSFQQVKEYVLDYKWIQIWTSNGISFHKKIIQDCARNGFRFGAGIDSDVGPKWTQIWIRNGVRFGRGIIAIWNGE